MILFFIILIVVIVYLIKSLSETNEDNTKINPKVVQKDHYTKMISFAEPIANELIEKGFTDLLLSDFYIDKNKNKIDLHSEETAMKSITPIFMMILARLKLPFLVKLEVHFVNNTASNTKTYVNAGFYNGQWGSRTITINIDRGYTLENILAILCHETTHYFMQYHNLNCSDVKENELKTDTTACLIGFSKILREGYQVIETITPQFG